METTFSEGLDSMKYIHGLLYVTDMTLFSISIRRGSAETELGVPDGKHVPPFY